MLDGAISGFAFAGGRAGEVDASHFFLQSRELFGHFTFLVRQIESLMLTAKPPYSSARTLLTTGVLEAAMSSRHHGHAVVETPELAIAAPIL